MSDAVNDLNLERNRQEGRERRRGQAQSPTTAARALTGLHSSTDGQEEEVQEHSAPYIPAALVNRWGVMATVHPGGPQLHMCPRTHVDSVPPVRHESR